MRLFYDQMLYRHLLDLALFEGGTGKAFVAEVSPPPHIEDRHTPDYYAIEWGELLPETCTIETLPGDETFLEHLNQELTGKNIERLFIFPPFVSYRYLSTTLRKRYPGLDLQEIAVLSLVEQLGDGTRVGVLLPQNSLVFSGRAAFRRALFQRSQPRIVISHNDSSPTLLNMNTLIFEVGNVGDQTIRFFRPPGISEPQEQDIHADFRKLLKQGGGKTTYGFVLRESISPDATLWHEKYHPDLLARQEAIQHFGDTHLLGELMGFPPCLRLNKSTPLLAGEGNEGIPVLEARNILKDNALAYESTRYRSREIDEFLLKAGDICMRRIIGLGDVVRLPVVEITEEMLPLVAAHSVIVLRPEKPMSSEERDVLLAYLRSSQAFEFLQAQGIGINLDYKVLQNLPVPVPDETLILSIRSLNQASQQFASWRAEIEQERDRLFTTFEEYAPVKEARSNLLSVGRLMRQRLEAASMVSDFRHRIRTQFPHPLAYRWRVVESSKPNLNGYIQVLECAEVAACYLALVAIVLATGVSECEIKWLSEMSKRLAGKNPRGTNFGDWVAILREVRDAKCFRRIDELVPFYEVLHFLNDSTVDSALQRLKDWRDAQSHGRGPKDETPEVASKFEESLKDLETLLGASEFLAEYHLRYIERTQYDTIQRIMRYDYRNLIGDHPLVQLQNGETSMNELEAGSLYLVDRTGALRLLRPFLTRRYCEKCGSTETFYLDTYDPVNDMCSLKSLERGHSLESKEISSVFRRAGLLKMT